LIDDKYNQLMFGMDGDSFCQSTQPIFKQVRLKLRRVLDMVARIASMSDSLISRMALDSDGRGQAWIIDRERVISTSQVKERMDLLERIVRNVPYPPPLPVPGAIPGRR
jgi:hypothetical protein